MAANGRDPFAVDENRALDALALAWGDAYDVYIVDGQWQAWHKDAGDRDIALARPDSSP
jgi:hypothetical protein